MPAGGVVNRSRAAPGISLPALRDWGARCSLDWDRSKAGNARKNCVGSAPGMGIVTGSAPIPSPRKHGLEQGPWEEISPGPEPWWNADRRAAPSLSSPACGGGYGGGQRPCQQHGTRTNASVGVPLPFLMLGEARRSGQRNSRHHPFFFRHAVLLRTSRPWRWQNSGAHAPRERAALHPPP